MTDDIVVRLRQKGDRVSVPLPIGVKGVVTQRFKINTDPECAEAADEIERLRAFIQTNRSQIMSSHKPLPVAGYTAQMDENVKMVNLNKRDEERILRSIDSYAMSPHVDERWLSIARTHIEQGFMAMNRAIFKPQRIKLNGDNE